MKKKKKERRIRQIDVEENSDKDSFDSSLVMARLLELRSTKLKSNNQGHMFP